MAKWLAKEFDWDTGRYTGRYYDIAEPGIVAVFVDSFYGDDTAAGTAAAPFKTLGKAITTLNSTGANGSRIFMNGVFSENLPAQTYWYEFIGCGGGRNGKTLLVYNPSLNLGIITTLNRRWHNIETVNYGGTLFYTSGGTHNFYIVNSFLSNCRFSCTYLSVYSYFNFYKEVELYYIQGGTNFTTYGEKNIFYKCTTTNQKVFARCLNSLIFDCVGLFNLVGLGGLKDIEPQFIKPTENDFNVRITSPLLQAGTVDEITGIAANVGGVQVGLPYNGISPEFTTEGGAIITDLTIDTSGKFTITAPATTGTLETALMDLGNIYPLENIDLFNVFDFLDGEITQGVFETFSSPRMALTIKLKYGLTSAEVDDCPWLLIEYGKQPTFSGTGANRVGNAADTFDPDTFQTITCRYMKLFVTLQDNS